MKQLIGLIQLSGLTALSVALYSAYRRREATRTGHERDSKKPDRQVASKGELVLLRIDGTVIAREVNLTRHGS